MGFKGNLSLLDILFLLFSRGLKQMEGILGEASTSILSRDPHLFRKPSTIQGKQLVFEKNDG